LQAEQIRRPRPPQAMHGGVENLIWAPQTSANMTDRVSVKFSLLCRVIQLTAVHVAAQARILDRAAICCATDGLISRCARHEI